MPSVPALHASATAQPPAPRPGVLRLLQRDLRLLWRRRTDAALALGFFLVSTALQPLGLGAEASVLRQIAPGVLWMAALLAALMPLPQLFAADHADGTLEQVALSDWPLWVYASVRIASHWLATGLPLVLMAPLLGLLYGLSGPELATLVLGLLLGTPVLSLLGGLMAALTTGVRSAGVLVLLLTLPLVVPVLIFGTGAVQAVQGGLSPSANLSLLGAELLFSAVLAPWLTAQALRMALD